MCHSKIFNLNPITYLIHLELKSMESVELFKNDPYLTLNLSSTSDGSYITGETIQILTMKLILMSCSFSHEIKFYTFNTIYKKVFSMNQSFFKLSQ